jgi:hypothetical protein
LALAVSGASADDPTSTSTAQPNLVRQANAPLSSILQLRLQNTWLPRFDRVDGQGNTLQLSVTMPLPGYRLLPFP